MRGYGELVPVRGPRGHGGRERPEVDRDSSPFPSAENYCSLGRERINYLIPMLYIYCSPLFSPKRDKE